MINPSKSESLVWRAAKHYKNGLRRSGDEIWDLDSAHNDIEVYDKRGKHRGSRDPTTGAMYKRRLVLQELNSLQVGRARPIRVDPSKPWAGPVVNAWPVDHSQPTGIPAGCNARARGRWHARLAVERTCMAER